MLVLSYDLKALQVSRQMLK